MPNKNRSSSILLVIDSLGSGGAQRQLVGLATGLAKRGFDVAVFIFYPENDHFRSELEENDIEIIETKKRYRFDLNPVLRIRRSIASHHVDYVISFLGTPNIYSILATIGNPRTKVVVSERFMFPDGQLNLSVWLRYQFYRFADAITVNSFHQKERILRKFPWSRQRLSAIWNGVDVSKFARRSLPAVNNENKISLLAVASIVDWKNAYNLIKALALVNSEGAELRIDWAGRVQPTDDSLNEYERCQKLIHDSELGMHWRWLGVCENMHEVYPTYDALVHPSFMEGLPNAICEALASGLPVLASNVCDHPLLVNVGVNGWLFDPGDPYSIAGVLRTFSQLSESERNKMSHKSRQFAEMNFGMDIFVTAYEDLICNI